MVIFHSYVKLPEGKPSWFSKISLGRLFLGKLFDGSDENHLGELGSDCLLWDLCCQVKLKWRSPENSIWIQKSWMAFILVHDMLAATIQFQVVFHTQGSPKRFSLELNHEIHLGHHYIISIHVIYLLRYPMLNVHWQTSHGIFRHGAALSPGWSDPPCWMWRNSYQPVGFVWK